VSDLLDLQYKLAETVRAWAGSPGMPLSAGQPILLSYLVTTVGASEHEIVAALEVMVRKGYARVIRWNAGRYVTYRPGLCAFHDFVCPEFRMLLTPDGMEWFDLERRVKAGSAALSTGDDSGDAVVRRTLNEIVKGRTLPVDRRSIIERILVKLVWIGVQNYRDKEFLSGPAQLAAQERVGRRKRRDLEIRFYQPRIYSELARDSELGRHLTKGSEQAGGACDLLAVGEFPIEIKVIYPEESRDCADEIGVGQATQYAARSGIGFVSILDMRPRTTIAELGQLANDVRVVDLPKNGGPNSVRIVQVHHVAGHGPPSKVVP
jgi:hypothetical protein